MYIVRTSAHLYHCTQFNRRHTCIQVYMYVHVHDGSSLLAGLHCDNRFYVPIRTELHERIHNNIIIILVNCLVTSNLLC